MPTKAKTIKPAAPAGKPARKSAKPAKSVPITIGGLTGDVFPTEALACLVNTLPSKRLADLLRERSLPIPKNKDTMVDRLTEWAVRQGGNFTLNLH